MILISIKPTRIPNRVFLKFSNGLFLPFSLDDVVTFKLSVGKEIDNDELKVITNQSISYLLYQYSLNQIAISPKNETVLVKKLRAKIAFYLKKYNLDKNDIDPKIPASVIDRLNQQHLLNEKAFAESLIRKYSHKSNKEILYRLKLNGVDPKDIRLDPSDEDQKIRKLLSKRLKPGTNLSDPLERNRIISWLARKGFAIDSILSIIDDSR